MGHEITRLRSEYLTEPVGLDTPRPRLSWVVESTERDVDQQAYRITVATSPQLLDEDAPDLWDSGVVDSAATQQIEYDGQPLQPRQRVWWRVAVRTTDGEVTTSPVTFWEMGLMEQGWEGDWITLPPLPAERTDFRPAPFFRTSFAASKVTRARLYATALGIYRASVNGQPVGDEALRPGWTDYTQLVQYRTWDVTDLVQDGDNAVGLVVGEGWYSGHLGVAATRQSYGPDSAVRAMLILDHEDGSTTTVATDESWKAAYGPIIAADLLKGEIFDARLAFSGWDAPGFDDTTWEPATVAQDPGIPIVAEQYEPVRPVEELTPQSVTSPVFQTWVFDMGQNLVGWSKLSVDAPAGTELRIRHGEALTDHGTVYTENLRLAYQEDRYVAAGTGTEVWEPQFTFHGFRYVEVEAPLAELGPDAITARVVHNDMPRAGEFSCSNEMVTKLWNNALWTQRGNFIECPTDCPQRNERMGWLGDGRIFSSTARLNYDVAAFFTKWIRDQRLGRTPDGLYPDFAPWIGPGTDGAPGWADAGVFLPYLMYETYGDTRIIDENFDAMAGFIDVILKANPDLIRTNRVGINWGDWLSMPEDDPELGRGSGIIIDSVYSTTPKDLFATAFFARSTELLARMAEAVERKDEAVELRDLAARIRDAFNDRFVKDDGKLEGDTQTAYALAIMFDLLDEQRRELAGKHLAAAVHRHDDHISTGISGTEVILPALTATGHLDLAYTLLLQDTFPSWGYSIRNGATTIWERWDGWTEEHGFQDIRMNSFNHYALGAVAGWIFETVGGLSLDPATPAAGNFLVRPQPGGGITSGAASHDSIRGPASVSWRQDAAFEVEVTVPPTATADVHLPAGQALESGAPASEVTGVRSVQPSEDGQVITVGSGTYRFAVR